MGRRIPHYLAPYYAGINIHPYSLAVGSNTWTYPENTNSEFQSIANAVEFRNTNMPNQMVHATEFGWDSDPALGGVGLEAQAAYIIRGILMMARAGVERSILFNSNDGPESHADFFKTAGLFETGDYGSCSNDVNYYASPKQSYLAIEEFIKFLGGTKHFKVLEESSGEDGVYAYLLGDADFPTHIVAWRPIEMKSDGSDAYTSIPKTISIPSSFDLEVQGPGMWLDGLTINYPGYPEISGGNIILDILAPTPVLIPLKKANDCDHVFSGRIYTVCDGIEDQPVPGVSVKLNGGLNPSHFDITDENGYYEINGVCLAQTQNWTLEPTLLEADPCGLTQNDVEIINNHLDGITQLNSPYKLIAADISANQTIDDPDPTLLGQFIDGEIPDFFSFEGQHWLFINEEYIFPYPMDPFFPAFPQTISYNGPIVNQIKQDFIAVKVGDVDCSYVSDCNIEQLKCFTVSDECGDAEEVGGNTNIYSSDLDLGTTLTGLIFNNVNIPDEATIVDARIIFTAFNSSDDEPCFLEIRGEAGGSDNCFVHGLNNNNISNRPQTNAVANWNITDIWQQGEIYESPDITEIIQEIVDAPTFGVNSPIILMLDELPLNNGDRAATSFKDNTIENAPRLCLTYLPGIDGVDFGKGKTNKKEGIHHYNNSEITNVRNHPNPFNDYTSLEFQLSKDSEIKLMIYNILGQVVHHQTLSLKAGHHQIKIDDLPLQISTVLNYSLETDKERVSGKMIHFK